MKIFEESQTKYQGSFFSLRAYGSDRVTQSSFFFLFVPVWRKRTERAGNSDVFLRRAELCRRRAGSVPAVPRSQLCCTNGVRTQNSAQNRFEYRSVVASGRGIRT